MSNPDQRPDTPDPEDREEIHRRVQSNLALLVLYTQAEQQTDRGGSYIELEHHAWYAMETMLRDAYHAITELYDEDEVHVVRRDRPIATTSAKTRGGVQ